ncbi:ATP-binding cassette domain-containing protein [Streptomyces sp. R44]|uniref:ABC transporter ATP-binding protein n=1 Tax=Streptomyces sp. R44 TaxID=3238633 RepID=A0AB39SRS0_9ACTN
MTSPTPTTPVVELVKAGFAYEDGPAVLSGVDFAVAEGRAIALLGRNGSGKTTLLRLLSGGLRCGSGSLLLDGAEVSYDRKGLTRLRTTVQLVVQDPDDQLFAASVGQDVSFGPMNLGLPEEEVRLRVREALEALDIVALEDRPTHLLSYGQRKRAAIAGAVAMRPRVLIMDEPTAGLDPHGQERLLDALERLRAGGTTVVMATHDVDLALRWADEAAVLSPAGLRTGPVAELLADDELLAAARLRRPWGTSVARLLRAHGLLGEDAAEPRTPEDLDAWAGTVGTGTGTAGTRTAGAGTAGGGTAGAGTAGGPLVPARQATE